MSLFRDDSALIAELRAQLATERERSAELMRTIVEMRREGFNAPVAAPPPPEPQDVLPEEVTDAMGQRAVPGTAAWDMMAEAADRLIRQGAPASEAAAAVLRGESITIGWD